MRQQACWQQERACLCHAYIMRCRSPFMSDESHATALAPPRVSMRFMREMRDAQRVSPCYILRRCNRAALEYLIRASAAIMLAYERRRYCARSAYERECTSARMQPCSYDAHYSRHDRVSAAMLRFRHVDLRHGHYALVAIISLRHAFRHFRHADASRFYVDVYALAFHA